MAKKQFNIRISESSYQYIQEKCANENKTQAECIESLLRFDQQKKNGYVDDLAQAITNQLNEKLKSMRIAVNENNKLLKVQGRVLNYQLLAHELKMKYDEYGNYEHFAFEYATTEVKEEIKRLQVIKSDQRKKVKGNT